MSQMSISDAAKEDKGRGRISHGEAGTKEIKALQEEKLKPKQGTASRPGWGTLKYLPQGTLSLSRPLGKGENMLPLGGTMS